MKVLVTGREGQLARSLVERAGGESGLRIAALGRPGLDFERSESIAGVIASERPEIIVNAAAYTAVDQAEDEPERARLINAEAPAMLAAAARDAGARIIHISTDYVFDGEKEGAYREEDVTGPVSVYGRTKLAGEEGVRRENPNHAIVRTAWVYSPFGRNFLKTMMSLAEGKDELQVVADQHGNPTSALDLADGLLTMMAFWRDGAEAGLGETYHLAGSGEASWKDFAEFIFLETSRLGLPSARVSPIRSSDWVTKARRPMNSTLDCTKFTADFGFKMPDWRISARETVERLATDRAAV